MRPNGTTFPSSTISRSAVVPCLERAAQLFSLEPTLELERWIEYTRALADASANGTFD